MDCKLNVEANPMNETSAKMLKRRLSSLSDVSDRLKKRRSLHIRRKCIADSSLFLAFGGIVSMIIHLELFFNVEHTTESLLNIDYVMKITTTILTFLLLIFIISYHVTEMQLFLVDNCLLDFRLALSWERLMCLILELLICFIHPFDYFNSSGTSWVGFSEILGLLMCLRVYLLLRVFVLHSWINRHPWARGVSSINGVDLNVGFALKSLMLEQSVTVLTILIVVILTWGSWVVRICEMRNLRIDDNPVEKGIVKMWDSMWLIVITFLGVGYGDIVPTTYCGRSACVLTAIFGSGITALTVAILASKLELNSQESNVHYFIIQSQVYRELKNAAAKIIQCTWRSHKAKLNSKHFMDIQSDCCSHRQSHLFWDRKVLKTICIFRKLQQRMMHINDEQKSKLYNSNSNNSTDTNNTQIIKKINHSEKQQTQMEKKLDLLSTNVAEINARLDKLLSSKQL